MIFTSIDSGTISLNATIQPKIKSLFEPLEMFDDHIRTSHEDVKLKKCVIVVELKSSYNFEAAKFQLLRRIAAGTGIDLDLGTTTAALEQLIDTAIAEEFDISIELPRLGKLQLYDGSTNNHMLRFSFDVTRSLRRLLAMENNVLYGQDDSFDYLVGIIVKGTQASQTISYQRMWSFDYELITKKKETSRILG